MGLKIKTAQLLQCLLRHTKIWNSTGITMITSSNYFRTPSAGSSGDRFGSLHKQKVNRYFVNVSILCSVRWLCTFFSIFPLFFAQQHWNSLWKMTIHWILNDTVFTNNTFQKLEAATLHERRVDSTRVDADQLVDELFKNTNIANDSAEAEGKQLQK